MNLDITSDPDWLFLVLYALRKKNQSQAPPQRARDEDDITTELEYSAPVLDSLASLLVREPGHTVAAAFTRLTIADPQAGPARLLIAQNAGSDVLELVQSHLTFIVDHLRKLRDVHVQDRPNRQPGEALTMYTKSPAGAKLAELQVSGEIALLKYSWKEIKSRFEEDGRYRMFLDLLEDVRGNPTHRRARYRDEERRALKALQDCSPEDRTHLDHVRDTIKGIHRLLSYNIASGPLDGPTDEDRKVLYELRRWFHLVHRRIADWSHVWSRCDAYLRVRYRPRKPEQQSEARRTSPKPFRVGQWLSEVVSVSADYVRIRRVATSSTMASLFFNDQGDPPEVVLVPDQEPQRSTTVSESDVKSTLRAAGWADIDDAHYVQFLAELSRDLTTFTGGAAESDSACSESPLCPSVHPECALLTHLHEELQEPIVPYIGISNPPCLMCDLYIESYRAATGIPWSSRLPGTSLQLVPWRKPSTLSTGPDGITAATKVAISKMCEELMAQIFVEIELARYTLYRAAGPLKLADD